MLRSQSSYQSISQICLLNSQIKIKFYSLVHPTKDNKIKCQTLTQTSRAIEEVCHQVAQVHSNRRDRVTNKNRQDRAHSSHLERNSLKEDQTNYLSNKIQEVRYCTINNCPTRSNTMLVVQVIIVTNTQTTPTAITTSYTSRSSSHEHGKPHESLITF